MIAQSHLRKVHNSANTRLYAHNKNQSRQSVYISICESPREGGRSFPVLGSWQGRSIIMAIP